MCPFEVLSHTADIGIAVRGRNLEELFRDAARGLFTVMLPETPNGIGCERNFRLDAPDVETLLVDWLSELLFLFDVERFVTDDVEFDSISDSLLSVHCRGITATEISGGTEVKAITHHMLKVRRTETGLEAEIYFDL
jgi:SHS2 domain-containing protein